MYPEDRRMDPEKVEFNASVCDLILARALVFLGGDWAAVRSARLSGCNLGDATEVVVH